jgi:hypothetical protein
MNRINTTDVSTRYIAKGTLSMKRSLAIAVGLLTCGSVGVAVAATPSGLLSPSSKAVKPSFDMVATRITSDGNIATFSMQVSGKAGRSKPTRTGKLAGASVFSYVWPTTIDPAEVG